MRFQYRLALVWSLVTALVVGVVTPVGAEENPTDPERVSTEEVLQLPMEESADPVQPDSSLLASDTPGAVVETAAPADEPSGGPVGLVADGELPPESAIVDRDVFETTYDMGDGVKMVQLSQEPLNVEIDGEWVNRPRFDAAVMRVAALG